MNEIIKNLKKDVFGTIEGLSIEELIDVINLTTELYYNKQPIIDDNTFDVLVDYLRLKDPKNKVLKQIGTSVKSKDDVELPYFLGSMDKLRPYVESEVKKFKKWVKNYKKPYYLSDKLDGISALIVYNFDDTVRMYTRGSAIMGKDITPLIKYFSNIPSIEDIKSFCKIYKIQGKKCYLAFRGELVMTKDIFEKRWSKDKKNIRNTVGGLVNSKRVNPKLARDTRFVCYNILDPNTFIKRQYEVIEKLGLHCVHYRDTDKISMDLLSKYLIKRKEKSKYDIDGVIVTNNDFHTLNVDANPEYAFAFKNILDDQKVIATVKNVEWNVSKDKRIKPVVIINKVTIGGVDINRVTGNNARFIKDNGIGKGTELEIIRSGDVIPKIIRIVKKTKPLFPDMEYEWDKNNVEIKIVGDNISDVNIKNIYYFFSQLDTKGMGERIVRKLYENNIDTIVKILKMKKEDLLDIEGFKEKSADNLVKAVKKSVTNKTLAEIMNASNKLGSGMGIERMKIITSTYPSILSNKWNKEQFVQKIKDIDGFDDITANIFVNNFKSFMKFYNNIKNLISIKEKVVKKNGKYKDMKIVVSGFRDKDIISYIENEGGVLTNSISKNTDLLVIKDNTVMDTSKVIKAKELGIKIITKEKVI
jgi:NAD-dependent DNA ligase